MQYANCITFWSMKGRKSSVSRHLLKTFGCRKIFWMANNVNDKYFKNRYISHGVVGAIRIGFWYILFHRLTPNVCESFNLCSFMQTGF